MDVSIFGAEVLKIRVSEAQPRFSVEPIVILGKKNDTAFVHEMNAADAVTMEWKGGEWGVRLEKNPFRVHVVAADGDVLMSLNARDMFQFEHTRSKEEDTDVPQMVPKDGASQPEEWDEASDGVWEPPMVENPLFKSRWEESFGGNTDHKRNGPTAIGTDVRFPGAKHVYGIPEHASSLALKPTLDTDGKPLDDPFRMYNLDVFEYELDNTMALYGAVPLMLAHSAKRTVGFFWLNAAETYVDVSTRTDDWIDTHWFSESGDMEMFVLPGPTPRDVMRQYAFLTGTTPLPPTFGIAYHQCKWNYRSADEVAEVDQGFEDADMPMDVIWLDIEHTDGKRYFTWNKDLFPEPKAMLDGVGAHHRRMVNIVDPHLKRDSNYYVHQSAESASAYVRNRDGGTFEGSCWPGQSSWPDFLDDKVSEWWSSQFAYDKYEGSTDRLFVWNDMNEPSVFSGPEVTMPKDVLHVGDVEHRDVHNIYGMLQHRATWNGLLARDAKPKRPFLLTRAFFPGSQRYGAVWTGDNDASWEHLRVAQPMLLSLAVGGISFAGSDVGGFFRNPSTELLTRWFQAGAFHPFFREHGHHDTRRKEPFLFDEPYKSVMRNALRQRYALLPYWTIVFHRGARDGMPAMRPMFMAFPHDESLFAEEQQFMVGDALLVRPVTTQGATREEVQLPVAGGVENAPPVWWDWHSGIGYKAGVVVKYDVSDISTPIPVLQRGGTIVPIRLRPRRASDAMVGDPYTLMIAPNTQRGATGDLYADDGLSFEYRDRSAFVWRRFVMQSSGPLQLTVRSYAVEQSGKAASDPVTEPWRHARIERMIVAGIGADSIASVTIRTTQRTAPEPLSYFNDVGVQKDRLVIRNPGVPINEDFEITLDLKPRH